MKMITNTACILMGAIAFAGHSLAVDEIPERHAIFPLDDAEAYEFANSCGDMHIPRLQFEQAVNTVKQKKSTTTRPEDKSKPYVHYAANAIYCVQRSRHGNPVIPLSVFNRTIEFEGMTEAETIALRTGVSKRLALNGIATALVVYENGNANLIAYMFTRSKPDKLYYRSTFLKKEDIVRADYGWVVDAAYTSLTTHNRGEGKYWVKSIYEE